MSILWKIAENKIQEWLNKDESEKPASSKVSLKETKPYESYLLEDIMQLIEDAQDKPEEDRAILLKRADEMEMKLIMSYENSGFTLMARSTAERLYQHRLKYASM